MPGASAANHRGTSTITEILTSNVKHHAQAPHFAGCIAGVPIAKWPQCSRQRRQACDAYGLGAHLLSKCLQEVADLAGVVADLGKRPHDDPQALSLKVPAQPQTRSAQIEDGRMPPCRCMVLMAICPSQAGTVAGWRLELLVKHW